MIHRAYDLQGKEVKGYHFYDIANNKHYILTGLTPIKFIVNSYEIDPKTLAMDTTVKAKKGEFIFGSIPVDGEMSEGGDRVRARQGRNTSLAVGQIEWNTQKACFMFFTIQNKEYFINSTFGSSVEIIAPAGDVEDSKKANQ